MKKINPVWDKIMNDRILCSECARMMNAKIRNYCSKHSTSIIVNDKFVEIQKFIEEKTWREKQDDFWKQEVPSKFVFQRGEKHE